uniref:Uncharacterized protein n=1 Tax=Aegilops tauschii subsp. strangulata TaxID=200361 RepID=A0A453Q5R5_AEGTS
MSAWVRQIRHHVFGSWISHPTNIIRGDVRIGKPQKLYVGT